MASVNRDIAQLIAGIEALQKTVEVSASPYRDPAALLRVYGVEPYAWQLEAITSKARRVLLNYSRQAGKTLVAAVAILIMVLFRPGTTALCISPTGRQSGLLFLRCLEVFCACLLRITRGCLQVLGKLPP